MAGGHQPVLLDETIDALSIRPDGRYVDATLGGGGHAEGIRQRLGPRGRLIGIDRDAEAVDRVADRFVGDARVRLLHGAFGTLDELLRAEGETPVDGVVFDFGISSTQLDDEERGFAFSKKGPLDMRMDRTSAVTVADLVATASAEELADWIFRFGEESASRRIARAVVREREREPIRDTVRLAEIVGRAVGGRRGRIHPATRTFQALRMVVNRELEQIEQGLQAAADVLSAGGRIAAISFHSLEDRIVKQFVKAHAGRDRALEGGGSVWEGALPRFRMVTRKPVTPTDEECRANPRSRSAKLRVAERIES